MYLNELFCGIIHRFGRFRQIWWITSADRLWSNLADFGRFGGLQVQADYGQIWQISADYKYKQTLWLDLTDFGRFSGLQVQQQTPQFAAVD